MTEYQELNRKVRQLQRELWARHNPSTDAGIDDYGNPVCRPEEAYVDPEKLAGTLPENRYA